MKKLKSQILSVQFLLTVLPFFYIGIVFFSKAISNIFLGIIVLLFIFGLKSKKNSLSLNRKNWIIYLLIVTPFLLTLLSVFYSSNYIIGLKSIKMRIPILFLPFIIITTNYKTATIIKGLYSFIYLSIIASLISIFNALIFFNEGIVFQPNFTSFITIIQHPYFGIYLLIAIVSIIEFKLFKNRYIRLIFFTLLFFGISLTTSRLVYTLFFILFIYYIFKKNSIKKSIALFFLTLSVLFIFIISNHNLQEKFKTSFSYENSPRLKLWNNAFKVFSNSNRFFFGIGIGDYYENKKDVYYFEDSKTGTYGYNPHSQIIEFVLTTGIVGFLFLLIVFILEINLLSQQIAYAIIVFSIIFSFSFSESIFNRQFGVTLYSVFIPLIFKENFKRLK